MLTLFNQLRVLDLSSVLAGPSVAMFFAELGATVTKIENPRIGGDASRKWKLPVEDPDSRISAYFASINYRKTYLWMDLGDGQSRPELERLIRDSDLVISNFKKGDEEKFHLTFTDLQAINPSIIHGKIKGYDSKEHRVAYDVVLQAETGYMYMNGTPESGPVKLPVAFIDMLAAHQLKEGLLCALIERERTGRGSEVEASLEKAALAALANQGSNYLMTGTIPERAGSLNPNIAPYGETFNCRDQRQIVLAVGSDKQFDKLCSILGAPDLAKDNRFASNQQRVIHRKEMSDLLEPLFEAKTASEWMPFFIAESVPAGIIQRMDEVMENPAAQEMVREEMIEGVHTRRMASVAFSIHP